MNKRKPKLCRKVISGVRCTAEAHSAQHHYSEQLCTLHQWAKWGKIAKNWTEAEARAYVANLEGK